uniref:HYR-like domain-containing protein n=3 Tax=Gelidibacter sp. TaxID=2018083 RepID=UPI00404B6B30
MSNFTRSGGRANYWQSITNLSCCSIDSITKQLRSLKAFAFIAVFLFSIGSMDASTFFNRCINDVPAGPSEADVANLYMNQCVGTQAVVVKSTDLTGDDCNWQVIYTYEISCGDFQEQIKIMYEGGDLTAPALIDGAQIPGDQSNLNLCYDEIPVGPSAEDIAALYSDNCSDVTVIKKGIPVGNNCEWSVIYSYEITDACGNEAQEVKITYSGGDTEAPALVKNAVIPTGDLNVNACFLNKSQGPSEEEIAALFGDNCSDVITVVKTASSKGTDCKWLAIYEYTVSDACGNFAEPIKIIYQGSDKNAPVLDGVPDDLTISCIDELPDSPKVSATDDCSSVKVDYSEDLSGLGLACAGGTVIRTWSSTDPCGNIVSESQTITVTPAPQPEFETPQDYKISCEDLANFQPTSLSYSNGITSGSCAVNGEVVGIAEPFEGSCGSFVVNFSYTDDCDYTITSSLTVTVEDLTAPEISGGNNLKVECDGQGNVEALEAWLASNGGLTAVDNCGNVTWSNNFNGLSDDCGATGTATVEFTAVDDCGNSSKASVTFTIEDTENPSIDVVASNLTVECDGLGNLEELNAWLSSNGGAEASDACSDVTWSNDFEALSEKCGATGSTTVIFIVSDACGNTSKAIGTFTIIDTTNPEITPASDLTVECDGQGNVEALEAWLASNGGASASDACSDVVWSNNFDGLSDECGATGSATVTFTATDDCGNASETTATFTIEDTNSPPITYAAQDLTVECDGQGNVEALESWLASNGGAIAYDLCSEITWSNNFDGLSDDCGATGSATVIFTVYDACGLSSSTTATFTIEDTTNPEITPASDLTVECDGSGNVEALEAWLTSNGGATASDTCSDVVWSNNFDGLSDECGATGSATVIFTATDDCGNASETTATFTIEDTTNPFIDLAASNAKVECDGQGNVEALEAWLASNGGALSSDLCGDVSWSNDFDGLSDECGATGSALVVFTATDECGNTSKTSASFTIIDTTSPTIDVEAVDLTVECDGQGNVEALESWLASNGGATASDLCGNVSWSNNFDGLSDDCGATGSATVEFTATDDCGNTSKTTATFTIEDTTNPTIDVEADDLTVECDGQGNVEALEAWLASYGGASASDLCGGVTWSNNFDGLSDDCGATGSAMVTFTATDDCGNYSETTATFTIEDTTNPEVSDAQDLTVECDGQGNVEALEAWLASNGGSQAYDTCGGVTWTNNFDGLSDDCGATGSAMVTFTATDDCGNYSETTATFTIEDTTNPEVSDAQDLTVECDGQGNVEALEAWLESNGGAQAYDACSGVEWSNNFDGLSDECGATGSATVTFTATDECGNTSETTATFTIEDTTAPEFTFVPENLLLECDQEAPDTNATASDTCGDTTVTYQDYTDNTPWYALSTGGNGSVDFSALPNGFTATGSNTGSGNEYFTVGLTVVNSVNISFDWNFTSNDTGGIYDPLVVIINNEYFELYNGGANNASGSFSQSIPAGSTFGIGILTEDDVFGNASVVVSNLEIENKPYVCPITNTFVRLFTAVDACGNSSTATQLVEFQDTTAPVIEPAAADLTVECDGQGNVEALEAWLASNGGASATDACSEITWTNNFEVLSDDCGATGSATVTFTVTDACGNASETTATFTIEDTTNPTIDVEASDLTVECDGEGNVEALETWLATYGGASASDLCGGVVWSSNFDGLSDDCGATGSATVTFTATDDCGNTSETSATFTIEDTTAPEVSDAQDLTVECDGQGNVEALEAWLASNGGSQAYDVCGGVVWSNNFDGLSDDCGATGSATVEFTATDDCGNTSKTIATFTIEDTTAPEVSDAMDMTVECDGQGNVEALEAWLASNGGATASDTCSDVVWSNNFDGLSDECGATGSATVEFTATDECGNTSKTTATFTIEDTTLPVLIGELPQGESNVNACFDNIPQSLSEEEMAALYYEACGNVVVTKVSTPLGNDCSWAVLHRYVISDECGNELPPVKVYFNGGDKSAPELVEGAVIPQGETGLELCYDAIPAAPSESEIGALFTDNCGNVNVSSDVKVSGDNCAWEAIYTYFISDDCGNKADDVVIIYSGGDTTAPELVGEIPNGQNSLDLCLSEAPEGPSIEEIAALYTDNCGEVVVTKTPQTFGDDCDWIKLYVYQISDSCGNAATEVKVYYNGGDKTAPVAPEDEEFAYECGSEIPEAGDIKAIDACAGEIPGVLESEVTEGDDCSYTITRTYSFTDACGNTSTTKHIITVSDETAPVAPEDQEFTIECGSEIPDASSLKAIDACQGEVDGVLSENIQGEGCSQLITRTWTFTDACGNSSTTKHYISVVDESAPVIVCPEDVNFGENPAMNGDAPAGIIDKAPYSDNCDASGYTTTYSDDLSSQQYFGESDNLDIGCFQGNSLFAVVNFVRTGFDENGYAVYAQGSRQDTSQYYYTINYNSNNGRWETFEYDAASNTLLGLIWYNVSTDNTPSCNPSDWNIDGSVCSSIFVDCGFFYLDYTEYTLVRTFTQEDSCGNEGECSVTYTWIEGENNNNFAPSSAPEPTTANGAPISIGVEARTSQVELDFTAYPVPFDKEVNISYSFEFDTDVTIELYDTKGLLINSISNNRYVKGSTDKAYFDLSRTSNQMFYVKLTTSQGSVTKKIVSSSPNRRN